MKQKSRLGADPLGWITNTAPGADAEKDGHKPGESAGDSTPGTQAGDNEGSDARSVRASTRKQEKQDKQGIQNKQFKTNKQNLQDKPDLSGNQFLQGKQSNQPEGGGGGATKPDKQSLQCKHELPDKPEARPGDRALEDNGSTRKGLRDGWTRATFIVRTEHAEKIKRVAWWERRKVTDVVEEALAAYLAGKKPGRQPAD